MLALKSACKALLLVSLLGSVAPAQAGADLLNYQLKDLRNWSDSSTLANQAQVASIAMIFQPDCPWCKKQGAHLAELQKACGKELNLALIGFKGSKRQLKRELRHFEQTLNAVEADNQFLRMAGGIKAAPTTLFFDKDGNLLLKKRGYISQEKLMAAAQKMSKSNCQA